MPVRTLVSPGPVVTKTTAGAPDAMLASQAANAATLSWRQWVTVMPVPPSADQKNEMAPPDTPNACRTPRSSSASANATANVGSAMVAQLPLHPAEHGRGE